MNFLAEGYCHVCKIYTYIKKIWNFHVFFEEDHLLFSVQRKSIIFLGKNNTIIPDSIRKKIFHYNFFGKTIFLEHSKKEHMLFSSSDCSCFLSRNIGGLRISFSSLIVVAVDAELTRIIKFSLSSYWHIEGSWLLCVLHFPSFLKVLRTLIYRRV